MKVRIGWSGETERNTWQKMDVELEHEDLLRILRENNLPEGIDQKLPTKLCFQLVQNEAESLLLNKLKVVGYPEAKANNRISQLLQSTGEILDAIKDKLVPSGPNRAPSTRYERR